jgi:hypothetical protein
MIGRRDEALQHFARAVEVSREIKSPPFLAQSELAWAELLAKDNGETAAEHARAAFEQASAVGMDGIAARAEKLMKTRRPPPPMPVGVTSLSLRRVGKHWLLEAGARQVTLADSKGMSYLEVLVQAPYRQVHVLELAGIGEEGDAGPLLDDKAKQAYRARADELRRQLEEAKAFNDAGRIEVTQRELDQLGTELSRAFGLGGRERRAGSAAERARINVQRRLRDAVRRVSEQDTALGRHLELSVKTGLFCIYAPTWPGP